MRKITCLTVFLLPCLIPSNLESIKDRERGKYSSVSWYVRLYAVNPAYIEVTVDATKVPDDSTLSDVNFTVEFRNRQRGLIKQETYEFTDDKVGDLEGGSAHRRYFKHDHKSAVSVSGVRLTYTIWRQGTRHITGPPPEYAELESNINAEPDSDVRVVEPAPPVMPEAFNGEYRLFVDGIKQNGVLIIKYPEAYFSAGGRGAKYLPFSLSIEGHHVVMGLKRYRFRSNLFFKLDGYLSTQTADSIAGVAWKGDKTVGFYAIKLSTDSPAPPR